ncbi:phage tail tape measure protein [Sulfurospirillum cavolei]|uniref:phage tail tape measure protein n=1 Tax=Sulfurospirillum cavolei TaxID=366522 RepID=UPI00076499E4|nr:phage tail tape measure protein [Sulfurospirillum cavolei]
MSKMFALGIALTAKDMFSPAFSSLGSAIRNSTKDLKNFGTASAAIGTGLKGAQLATQGAVGEVIKSYADLEDAQIQLQNTLMKSDGSVSPFFKGINEEATKLGNALPGTTADFYAMASKLKSLGVEEQSIIGGALKSAAYLGVVLKIPYEEAAVSTAKFREALGIADSDLLVFIDDIQRLAHMGVEVGEMKFAFSKVGATMKGLGMMGLQAARDVEPLIGLLIKSGFSGETVGTNLGNMIESAVNFKGSKELKKQGIELTFNDTTGKFLGVENMIKELEQLKEIESDAARLNVIESLFGKGEAASMANVLIQKGTGGISEFNKKLKEQADLNMRVGNTTKSLRNTWEALTGTFSNLLAFLGEGIAPELKSVTNFLGDATAALADLTQEYPNVTKFLGGALVGFVALSGGLGTAAIAVSMFTTVLGVLGVTSMVTFGWIIAGAALIAGAATLIIANWDTLKGWFVSFGTWLADLLGGAATAIYAQFEPLFNWISKAFTWAFQSFNVADIFSSIAQSVVNIFSSLFSWIGSQITGAIEGFNTFASFITDLFTNPITTITGLFDSFFNWVGGKFQWVLDSVNGVKSFFGAESNVQQATSPSQQTIPIMARAGNIPAQGSTSNSVSVTIQNPNFSSPEEASRTQAQIDEQVRKALREIQRDQADRSFND